MSSPTASVETFGVTMLNLKKSSKDDTKGSLCDIESFDKYDSKNELVFEDVQNDEFWLEATEPIQLSILDEQQFQSVWSTDYSSLSQRDSPSDCASNFKHSWESVTASPLDTIIMPYNLSLYNPAFFPGMIHKPVSKTPKVQTSEVGVQTMTTSIHTFPIACRTHPVPWGLETDEPSPLTTHNITAHQRYRSNKRKCEDDDWAHATWPPTKKLCLALGDQEFLNNLFSFLKSPIDIYEYSEDYVTINEEGVVPPSTACEYEGFVEVHRSKYGTKSVATNTMHVPVSQGSSHLTRYRAWSHAAKQYLSDEDRVDKRGPRQGSYENRAQRMVHEIMSYYCRVGSCACKHPKYCETHIF